MNDIGGGLDGHLAEGTHITGTLEFERAVQIDGRFEGHVKSKGKLILGPSAQVDAEIHVGELEVQGRLRGKVTAGRRLFIRDGGVVEANVNTHKLAIETGAIFRGACEMPEPQRPKPDPVTVPKMADSKPKDAARPAATSPGDAKATPSQDHRAAPVKRN